MTGTPNQIAMAEQIRVCAGAEFERVARAFHEVALKQAEPDRGDTRVILQILEEKRVAVMEMEQAGYFIQTWRELSDQVRQMIGSDPRYRAIQAKRRTRGEKFSRSANNATVHTDRIHAG
jgi:hypothetical protein